MKISACVLSTCRTRTGHVNRLKVFRVTLMFQLQLAARYQSHSKPLSNVNDTHVNITHSHTAWLGGIMVRVSDLQRGGYSIMNPDSW